MEYDPDDELLDAYRIELTTLRQRAEAAERRVRELEGAVKKMAEEWNAINHLASCGDYSNGVEGVSGTDTGVYLAVCEMERSARAINANPIAKEAIAKAAIDAAGGQG